MHIREIEIDNFKSFANKVTIPFLEGFTTISGPNGSGKSNIIDSVLFGLGLSTSRTLRAEKLFHLISTHTARNDASVKITFSDDDNHKTMVVERRIRKAPSGFLSSYYLDGKSSTLGEIHDNLAKYNISPGSYNVIMQGDVTTITNSSAGERRKILDEIAGISDFDRRIEQATKELCTVEERVEKSNIILGEIELRLEQLEEQRKKALKYQEYKEQKQDLESKLTTVKYFDIKNSLERLHENLLDANKSRKNQEKGLEKVLENLDKTKERLKEVSELVKQKGEDEQIEIKKQVEALKSSIETKKNTIAYINKQIEDNKLGATHAESNIVNLKGQIDDDLLKIENKKDEIKSLEKNIKREKEELDRVLKEVSDISKETDQNVAKRNILRSQLESKKDEENILIKNKLPLEQKISKLEGELKEAKEIIENFEETSAKRNSEKDTITVQIEELSKELKDYETIQKTSLYELDKTKNELSDASYSINLAYRKVAELEANKRAAHEANFGLPVDTIMKSQLPGVHAPLAQLGQVNKDYSTALEIAMGGRMRFIVVDDDEVASTGIEILKSSRAGRATFLPLNKIRSAPNNMRLPKEKGVIDFAINLVEFDELYRPAFYHALGDTIIVEDMLTARRLAGKYRMVTLDGSLVEKSGSMSGGANKRSGLKFSNTEDEELSLFKKRLEEFEINKEKLENKRIELEHKLDKVRTDYSGTMTEVSKKKMELGNIERTIAESEEVCEKKKELIEIQQPEIKKAQQEFEELNKKHSAITADLEKISKEIETVESTIPKDKLDELKELSGQVEFQIRSYQTNILNCQNDIKNIEVGISYTEQSIEASKERIAKLKKDNETFEQDKELNKVQIGQTEERVSELNEKIKEIGSKLIELQRQRDAVQAEVIEQEKSKNEIELLISRVIENIEALKTRRKELEPELFEIREELVQAGYQIASLQQLDISTEDVQKGIQRLEKKMEALGDVNMMAIKEFEDISERSEELKEKLETLNNEREQIITRMQSYEDLKKKTFLETFEAVNENFKIIFAELSDGKGQLILEKPEDPLNGGLTIEATPREKKMQRLESMSGGEKSLTALAFVFAIQKYMPAPFYAFDEVDMHLDGINVERLAEMVRKQAQDTQFIVVSLRKPMIESADRTVGVTQKDKGITKVTGVKLSEA